MRNTLLLPAFFLALVFHAARACDVPPPEGPGALYACPVEPGAPPGFCPLEHTDVRAAISGDIARVTVTQRFRNHLSSAIEAIYTFPLSEKAAVDRMHMKIGERIIVGQVKEREAARAAYDAAKQQGKTAALLDQERPNIFTQSVANVQPGDVIEVTLSYVEYLKHEADDYEFSFPMTVGPRYVPGAVLPGGAGTTQVPDAGAISPPLAPEGARAGHDIALEVLVDAAMPLGEVKSALHRVKIERPGESRAIVRLEREQEIPNRDFVLNYRVKGEGIREGVLVHRGEQGGYFTLWLQPPAEAAPREAVAKELVFVIDCSGSMSGFPIEKAKDTMARCIADLTGADTFNLVSFAGGMGYCFETAVPANRENKAKAQAYLANLQGGGGTEMLPAVQAALAPPYAKDRLRTVCFMTDGFIGNDMEILDAIQRRADRARVFSFGIGNGVNRFLIEGMAREGRGAAEIVTIESDAAAAVARFQKRIQRPVLTNITIDTGGLVADLVPAPEKLPDLFAGQPLRVTGRWERPGSGTITVRGETARGAFARKVDVVFPEAAPEHDALVSLWARGQVEALMAADWLGIQQGQPKAEIKQQIIDLGVNYSIVTQYTSFIAIEETARGKGQPATIGVPVELTDGVSREGIGGGGFGGGKPMPLGRSAQLNSLGYNVPAAPPAPAVQKRMELRMADGAAGAAPEAASVAPAPAPEPAPALMKEGAKVSEERDEAGDAKDDAAQAKLDPVLRGLAGKLVNGNYTGDGVRVVNNVVEVAVYLNDTADTTLAALRTLGVEVKSVSHAANKVLVRVHLRDLDKVAGLAVVQRIAPPAR